MPISITLCFTLIFLIMCCVMPGPSLSHDCSLEKMENVVIDMKLSLSKGIRGTEPIYTPTQEACINVCCLEKNISGNRQCNLMIFDAGRVSKYPNCYLFYCPSKEGCPMKPAKGFVSYTINRGVHIVDSQLADYNTKGNPLSSQAAHFDLPNQAGQQNHTAALQQSVTSLMSERRDYTEEHLDKIELRTQVPEDQEKKHPETLDTFPKHKITSVMPTRTAHTFQLSTSSLPFTTLPATTSLVFKTTTANTQVPTSTALTTADHMITHSRTTTESARLRTSTTAIKPIATSADSTSSIRLFSLSVVALLGKNSSAPFQTMQQDKRQRDAEGYLLDDVPKSKPIPQSGDKSGLVAALIFGMVFLLLVIALIGRRMSQSLQRRRYTRLDYLINGMYADV